MEQNLETTKIGSIDKNVNGSKQTRAVKNVTNQASSSQTYEKVYVLNENYLNSDDIIEYEDEIEV